MKIQWSARTQLNSTAAPGAIQFWLFQLGDLRRLGPVYQREETPAGVVEGWRSRPKGDPGSYVRDLLHAATFMIGQMIVAAAPVTPDKPLRRFATGAMA